MSDIFDQLSQGETPSQSSSSDIFDQLHAENNQANIGKVKGGVLSDILKESSESIPMFSTGSEFTQGMKSGQQLASPEILGIDLPSVVKTPLADTLGLILGGSRAINAINPLGQAIGLAGSQIPKYTQGLSQALGGDISGSQQTIIGNAPVIAPQVGYLNTGIPLIDVPVNSSGGIANEIYKNPMLLAAMTPGAISETGKAFRNVSSDIATASKNLPVALADSLRQSADKNVSQALSPTTIANKAAVEKITPQLLERPIRETFALTREGMEKKAEAQRQAAGEAVGDFGKISGEYDPKQVSNVLEKMKAPYIVEGRIIDQPAIDRIQGVQDVFNQFGDSISAEGLRQIKKTFSDEIAENNGFFTDPAMKSLNRIKKVAVGEILNTLNSDHPELAQINKNFSFWATLNDVLEATNQRTKPQKGLLSNLGAMAGAIAGHSAGGWEGAVIGGALGKGIITAMHSPGWKLLSAKVKYNLANLISDGDIKGVVLTLKDNGISTPELSDLTKKNYQLIDQLAQQLQAERQRLSATPAELAEGGEAANVMSQMEKEHVSRLEAERLKDAVSEQFPKAAEQVERESESASPSDINDALNATAQFDKANAENKLSQALRQGAEKGASKIFSEKAAKLKKQGTGPLLSDFWNSVNKGRDASSAIAELQRRRGNVDFKNQWPKIDDALKTAGVPIPTEGY